MERQKKPGPAKGTKFENIQRTAFGKRLYKVLRTRKISQRQLGERIGISNRMISYYVTNEAGPPLSVLKKMAAALGVTVSYLADESPLKNVDLDDTSPALKKDIERLKALPRKDQRTVSNTISGLHAKNQLQNAQARDRR